MTLEEFIRSMEGIGESVSSPQDIFLRVAGEFVNELQSRAPVDSGALKQNIQARVEEDSVLIQMFAYGFFQNYGVVGTQSNPGAFGVEDGAPTPRTGNTYSFNPDKSMIGGNLPFRARENIHKFGLRPKSFFSIEDIRTRMAQRIEEELTNNINNQL